MKIGIIGTGKLGTNLGKLWADKGHEILFGSRDPVRAKSLESTLEKDVKGGTYSEAANYADVVVLAVPWSAVQESLEEVGDLTGKILIDCTNAVAPKLGGLLMGHTTSAAEKIAEWAKGAKVVKAFNTLGAENLVDSQILEQTPSTFICGDDLKAKSVVR